MEFKNKSGICILGVLLGALAVQAADPVNQLTAAEKKAGWILLFDGKDKNAYWGNPGINQASGPWTIEDSAMRTINAYSFLCTKSAYQYSNFEWQADWKLKIKGNSGLFIRVVKDTYNDGYEYAILDDVNGDDASAVSDTNNRADRLPSGKMAYIKRTGAVYDLYPTTKNGIVGGQYYDSTVTKPYDQWNHGVIWANGNFIEHWLNGKKVVDVEIGTPDWDARFRNSKWKAIDKSLWSMWAKNPTGSLCLQAHGSDQDAWFRNLKVRPFTPGDTLVSPSVTPNGGTFSATMKAGLEVAITGAVIHYTIDGSEPTESSPTYTDSITIAATTTLKAKTFRAKFKNSSTTSAIFTKSGSAILKTDLSPLPDVSLMPISQGFIVQNKNANIFGGEVMDLNGSKVAAFFIGEGLREYTVHGLKTGVYLVKLQRGSWTQVQKIALH